MTEPTTSTIWQDVPSPFCGLAVDDLTIKTEGKILTVIKNGDPITKTGFESPITDISPRIKGETVSLERAVTYVTSLLAKSRQPVIAGMATDVNGARSAIALADKIGATIDHMDSAATLVNTLVLQDTGWVATTLTETRNRADLLLVVGSDIEAAFPRFYERMVWNKESMFDQDIGSRQVVYLGKNPSGCASTSPDGKRAQVIQCDHADLPEVTSVLRALIVNKTIQARYVGGIAVDDLANLAKQLKCASYSVIVWSAADLTFNHAEITVQTVCEMVKDLNTYTRSSCLPLGGKQGSITASQVCTWRSGYPVRVSFNRDYPNYDPYLANSNRMLANNETDVLLWVSSFSSCRTPPQSNAKTVVLGRSGMVFEQEPEVFIPIGTPGIDHDGCAFRADSAVAVPLKKMRDSGLPSVFSVLTAIYQIV